MTDKLLALADRCEAATGPNYGLDCEIWDAIYPGDRDERFSKLLEGPYKGRLGPADKDGYIKPLRSFTASLDAAMTLVDDGLVVVVMEEALKRLNEVFNPLHNYLTKLRLFVCAAALRARAAMQEQQSMKKRARAVAARGESFVG